MKSFEGRGKPTIESAVRNGLYSRFAFDEETPTEELLALGAREVSADLIDTIGWPTEQDKTLHTDLEYYGSEQVESFMADPQPEEDWSGLLRQLQGRTQDAEYAGVLGEDRAEKPALLRARALAPGLFEALSDTLRDVSVSDIAQVGELLEENPQLSYAVYMAYRIMGRLVTRDDRRIHAGRITGVPQPGIADVQSAHDEVLI